jgi:hypothetical protein
LAVNRRRGSPARCRGPSGRFIRSRRLQARADSAAREAKGHRYLAIDDELQFGWLLDRQIGRSGAAQILKDIPRPPNSASWDD